MSNLLSIPVMSSNFVTIGNPFGNFSVMTGNVDYLPVMDEPQVLAEPTVVDEDARRMDLAVVEILQRLEWLLSAPSIEYSIPVEQDIWMQMPPKSTFTINAKLQFEGRGKPKFFVDWVED